MRNSLPETYNLVHFPHCSHRIVLVFCCYYCFYYCFCCCSYYCYCFGNPVVVCLSYLTSLVGSPLSLTTSRVILTNDKKNEKTENEEVEEELHDDDGVMDRSLTQAVDTS